MALERVAELVRRASQDAGVLHALKNDPTKLRSALDLNGAHLDALNSATAFPLPDRSKASKVDASSIRIGAAKLAGAKVDAAAAPPGSLLPPEGSGQFTGATNGFAPQPGPAPGPPPTAPGKPPSAPAKPPAPAAPQPGPAPSEPPPAPQGPAPPPWVFPPPQVTPPGITHPPGTPGPPTDAGCECCAIAGMVAAVAATANTAITAITAITGIACRRS